MKDFMFYLFDRKFYFCQYIIATMLAILLILHFIYTIDRHINLIIFEYANLYKYTRI